MKYTQSYEHSDSEESAYLSVMSADGKKHRLDFEWELLEAGHGQYKCFQIIHPITLTLSK